MLKTKKDLKYSLRQCRKHVELHKSNGLAAALQADKINQKFSRKLRPQKTRSSVSWHWVNKV